MMVAADLLQGFLFEDNNEMLRFCHYARFIVTAASLSQQSWWFTAVCTSTEVISRIVVLKYCTLRFKPAVQWLMSMLDQGI